MKRILDFEKNYNYSKKITYKNLSFKFLDFKD